MKQARQAGKVTSQLLECIAYVVYMYLMRNLLLDRLHVHVRLARLEEFELGICCLPLSSWIASPATDVAVASATEAIKVKMQTSELAYMYSL